jgi:formylglycine-generating enzyme required for sulfatase activity
VAMMKPEHAETTLTLSARKFSGFSKDAKPIYSTTSETRILKLRESSDAFFPIHVSDAQEREAWGVHEVLLRVRARPVRPLGPAYGLISTVTDAPGAAILLDGGLVGYANKEGTLQLRNVSPGERRLIARDRSGRETRRIVDVTRDRTTLVRLPFAKEQSSSRDFVPLVDNQHGYLEYRRIQDGAVMVRIPQGEFLMGNLETVSCPLPHKVYVSEFAIDKTPVTWGQFKDFSQETGTPLPPEPYWGIHDDHPVTFVTWEEARTYCEWVGGRLPTEAEREKAARGTDQRMFPWGNEEPNPELTVFVHSWGSLATEPAGSHPAGASPYGVLDMAGNVWEWCQDWYEERYYEISPYRDPRGPRSGLAHVVRGGSWDSRPVVLSSSARNWGYVGYREGDYGFRCATDAARLDRD